MRFPRFLKDGGSIGFPAPSFGCATEPYYTAFLHALSVLREKGFLLYPGSNTFESSGVGISASPKDCAGEFMSMYADVDIETMISCGGGELMCEILDDMDFELLSKLPPKWFMGFSDNTNIDFLLATLSDTASIYGPCASSFGMEPWHPSISDALDLLQGKKLTMHSYELWEKNQIKSEEKPLEPYNVTEKRIHRIYRNGILSEGPAWKESMEVTGRLLGGCMDCLVNLLGTKYDKVKEFNQRYCEDGIIWLLEACDLNVYSIRRAMWQMEHAGWFETAKMFVIGRPVNSDDMFGLDAYQAVIPTAERLGIPVIMDVDLGHMSPMMPLVIGSLATVSAKENDLSIAMEMR